MQQGQTEQLPGVRKGLAARQQGRAADRDDLFGEENLGTLARDAAAEADLQVERGIALSVAGLGRDHPHLGLRMAGTESTEPGQQPEAGEAVVGADIEVRAAAARLQGLNRAGDAAEALVHGLQQAAAFAGQLDTAVPTDEQAQAKILFQLNELMTNRRLPDAQFACGRGEASQPARGFEDDPGPGWRQVAVFHGIDIMHVKDESKAPSRRRRGGPG